MKTSLSAIAGTTAIALCVIYLSLTPSFYNTSIDSQFFCIALLSVTLIHLSVRPWSDVGWVAAGVAVLAALDFGMMHFRPGLVPVASLVGMSSIAVLAAVTIRAPQAQRKVLLYGLIPAVLFVASEWLASILLAITQLLHPKTFDLYLYSFDASLRIQFSFLFGRWFANLPWLRLLSLGFYIGLPIIIALVYGRQLRSRGCAALPIALAFLITGPLGIVFYNFYPAMGPIHVFPSFPLDPLTLSQAARLSVEPIRLAGPRNAIPSLHMAWVLLAWWNSKGLAPWTRALAMAFIVFTVLATLGTGEHYFVDLVVAFPFTLIVQALSRYDIALRNRRLPLAMGLLMTGGWLTWLTYGVKLAWVSPFIPWIAVAATIISSIWLQRSLQPVALPLAFDQPVAGAALREVRTQD
jgi:hypothetical protein